MLAKNNIKKGKPQPNKEIKPTKERQSTLQNLENSDEYEIQIKATVTEQAKKLRFPKKYIDRLQLPPDEFVNVQNALLAHERESREIAVYADSIESFCGYDSLLRVLGKQYGKNVAFYRSAEGGSLSLEEARAQAYRRNITDEEGFKLLESLLATPADWISFTDLLELHECSPASAQNMWEMIKLAAGREFESGHRAAEVFEPVNYMQDAWNRASYLGLRESLCEEWQPRGGIELTMIDAIAQAWLQLQHWTKESVKRAQTRPRRENPNFIQWKDWHSRNKNAKQWEEGHWDIPYVEEQEAIEHATQMADRWQRMYFRAIRSLRDWRRYASQITINNANQVNIANDGGQQVNVSNNNEFKDKKITS